MKVGEETNQSSPRDTSARGDKIDSNDVAKELMNDYTFVPHIKSTD